MLTPAAAVPAIAAVSSRKWIVVAILTVKAAFLVSIVLAAERAPVAVIALLVFLTAPTMAAVQGVNSVTYYDLIGGLFGRDMLRRLVYRRSPLAGAAASALVAVLGAGAPALGQSASATHLHYLSAAVTLAGCILLALVEEPRAAFSAAPAAVPDQAHTGMRAVWRRFSAGLGKILGFGWFRRFLVARSCCCRSNWRCRSTRSTPRLCIAANSAIWACSSSRRALP
jgi:hypothetical protein